MKGLTLMVPKSLGETEWYEVRPVEEWFSNLSVNQNYPEGLLKIQVAGFSPKLWFRGGLQ